MPKRLGAIAVCMLVLPLRMCCAQAPGPSFEPWSMHDSFADGIPSWQSYPLAQDIGYDPSVYTTAPSGRPVLVRDVINEGQQTQSVGLIRPLKFRLTASTRISLAYSLRLAGKPIAAKLILAAENGARIEAPLPLNADLAHAYSLTGPTLLAHGKETNIEGVVILASSRSAPLGAHSLLTLAAFSVDASRPARMEMHSPKLLESSDESLPVAEGSISLGQPTHFAFASHPERAIVRDGAGKLVPSATIIERNEIRLTPVPSAAPGLWTIEASDRRASLTFKVLVLPPATGQSILFPLERWNQLRTEPRYSGLREAIHREAVRQAQSLYFNQQAGDSIALLPSESVHAGLIAYIGLMNNYGAAIAYGALDYRLNGDQKSLEAVREALSTVAKWRTWTPPWFTAHGMHTYYVVGVFTEQTSVGYDLVADQLSAGERRAVENALLTKSIQPTINDYFLSRRMPTSASNHMAHSVGGAIAAWAACARLDREWRAEHATALAELLAAYQGLLHGLFPGDGSEREPAGYQVFAMEGMTYGVAALKSLGIVPEGIATMMDSFWWLRYAEVSPHLLLDTGDTAQSLPGLYGFAWVAENSHDPAARWLYDTVARPVMEPSQAEGNRGEAPKAPNVLDLLCCTSPATPKPEPPPSRIFASRGSAVLRDGWDPGQTVISLRAGPWMNHEHHDQGSFQLASQADLLVGEGGYADYYRDPNYKDYFSEAPAHNVVTLDGDAFSQVPYDGVYYKAVAQYPRISSSLLTNGVDFLEANLQHAYGDALRRYRRSFLFLKPGLLVVSDDIEARSPHTYQWLLHPAPGAKIAPAQQGIKIEGHHAAVTLDASDEKLSWQVDPAPLPINDFTDLDRTAVPSRQVLSLHSPSSLQARFLVGLSVAATGEHSSIERQSTSVAEGFVQKRSGSQTTVLFRKHAGSLTAFDATADSDILAVIQGPSGNGEELFAAHALSLRLGRLLGFSLSQSGNVLLERTKTDALLTIDVEKSSTLIIEGLDPKATVTIEDKPQPEIAASRTLSLQPGEHRIRVTLQ